MNAETGQSVPQDMSTEGVPEVEQEPQHDHVFGVYCRTACPRWGNPEPQPGWEPQQDWFFTFGADHVHPETGNRLGRSFVRIHGTCDSTRMAMFAAFGNRWAFQYGSEQRAGVDEHGLTEVRMPAAVSFEDEVAVHAERLEADAQRRAMCAGLPLPVGDSVPACGMWASHYPHALGESVTFRSMEAAVERTPVEERIGEDPQRCPNCAPGYDCERGIYTPVTPAEERTGEDARAAVLGDIARLDRVIWEYTLARVQMRTALTQQAADERLANAERLRLEITEALGRIEAYVRGEQRG